MKAPLSQPASLYAHTLARMQPRQLMGILDRKARERVVPALPLDFDRRYNRQTPRRLRLTLDPLRSNTAVMRDALDPATRQAYDSRARASAAGEVTFMNRTLDIASDGRVDWYADELDDLPRLWRLKLYAFEPLRWTLLGSGGDATAVRESLESWVFDWIDTVEIGGRNYLRRAWTPYAVSLRLLNWSRYLACRDRDGEADAFDTALARELYKNASFLANHVERDVGGNHLIENGAGLVAAGTIFGEAGDVWVDEGVSVLEDAARSQFLDDGCHFERSPMYHVQTLTRYLTVRDLLVRTGRPVPELLEETAAHGAAFLAFLRPPDGELPLLNDSVHGQTLSLSACLDYARAIGIDDIDTPVSDPASTVPGGGGVQVEDRAGLGWLDTAVGRMLVDGGSVGPPHLPGHAHSDLLSYLLWLGDTPVVTDTGTYDYEGGERRRYARGVRGHNTVQFDDEEPIEIGDRFLMGSRPTPTVRWDRNDEITFFEGRYETRPATGTGHTHHRSIAAGDRWWLVWDRATGHEADVARSRVHLHPDVSASRTDSKALRLTGGSEASDDLTAWLHPLDATRVTVNNGRYFPQFGVEQDRKTIRVEAEGTSQSGFGYLLTADDRDSPAVTTDACATTCTLTLGDTQVEIPQSRLWP